MGPSKNQRQWAKFRVSCIYLYNSTTVENCKILELLKEKNNL